MSARPGVTQASHKPPPTRRRSLLELVEHFWLRVEVGAHDDCWLWTGQLNNKGYGVYMIYEDYSREKLLAHRFAALMAGMPVHSPKNVVMHSCDTPRCVNPRHLSVGTQKDNMRDAKAKGRMDITGLFEATLTCRDCGAAYRAHPSERFCPAHREAHRSRPRQKPVAS